VSYFTPAASAEGRTQFSRIFTGRDAHEHAGRIQAEFFNFPNHTQLNNPDTVVMHSNFGRIYRGALATNRADGSKILQQFGADDVPARLTASAHQPLPIFEPGSEKGRRWVKNGVQTT
jgi:hypothetical protein